MRAHAALLFLALAACDKPAASPNEGLAFAPTNPSAQPAASPAFASNPAQAQPQPQAQQHSTDEGLIIEDAAVGSGPEVKRGDKIRVHYVGTLENGVEFDSSRARNVPFEVNIGRGEVIRGWDEGMLGMRAGGHRRLTIPHTMAYGPHGSPPKIPPAATLIFEIELLAINP
jgi:FKBP-type peptidyl-prolyl cis-trans isomerase